MSSIVMMHYIFDLICENQPLPANSSFEKYSSKVFVATQLINYSSYFHQIFSIASAGHDLQGTMSVNTCMASLAHQLGGWGGGKLGY